MTTEANPLAWLTHDTTGLPLGSVRWVWHDTRTPPRAATLVRVLNPRLEPAGDDDGPSMAAEWDDAIQVAVVDLHGATA